MILLVAHKRKNNYSTNENDEVSGSSDVTNLAMITLAYESDPEIEEGQRRLKVAKNRLFGKKNTVGWVMDFDERSKRIVMTEEDIYKEYSWSEDFKQVSTMPFSEWKE